MNDAVLESPFVVRYAEIPQAPERSRSRLQVRPFLGDRLLGAIVPGQGVALELVQLPPGEEVSARRTMSRSLLIVLDGGAELVAGSRHPVRAGDVITLPPNFAYGIGAVGPSGLEALVVAFPEGGGDKPKEILSFDGLVARNTERAEATLQKRFFQMLSNGGLSSPADRRRFGECLRVFSNAFQTLLFTRQAMCGDGDHAALFVSHLREELGHNELLAGPDGAPVIFDPILQATASWFCNQMVVLDNLDKIIVNLVLETAGQHFHLLAEPVFVQDRCAKYFEAHSGVDDEHQHMGVPLLRDQPPEVYRRLSRVLERCWDMFEAMTGRIAEMVDADRKE
jgi:quercetin dioxygenase-like cupin family protein